MKRLLLLALLAASPSWAAPGAADGELSKQQVARQALVDKALKPPKAPPQSASWQKIYEQREIVFYYDPTLIEQKDRYVSIPYLVDLPVENHLNLRSVRLYSILSGSTGRKSP